MFIFPYLFIQIQPPKTLYFIAFNLLLSKYYILGLSNKVVESAMQLTQPWDL